MLDSSTAKTLISPPAAPEILVEEAGKLAQNLWWDDRDESLWWTDAEGGRLHRLNLRTGIQSAVYEGPNVGAFIGQEDGSWLLFREKDIVVLAFDRHAHVGPLLENLRFDGDRFSGALADEEGRVLVGTMRADRPNGAGVYRLDATGSLGKVLGGTGESCGMGFNVKGDALYWTCGTTRTICRCRYDVKRGAVSNRQVFHECGPEEGAPTALAVDEAGTIWSARRNAGVILKIAEDRRLVGQVTFPGSHVTSLTFGGKDRRSVFAAVQSREGCRIFVFQSPTPGMLLHRSRTERRDLA